MQLDKLYDQLSGAIAELEFKKIWPGFAPLKFALFDEERCFFDGNYIEKTDAFCANTSILYQGEQIATWKVEGELSLPVLTSKIVHEMFHGYQVQQNWNCYANEIEALFRYVYDADALSLKMCENSLLLALLDEFDEAACGKFLSCRKLRSEKYPYEFAYESSVEEIEGTATYVEWMVLKQLDLQAAAALETQMRAVIMEPRRLLPIRVSCYDTGALAVHAMVQAGVYSFDSAKHPAVNSILQGIQPSRGEFSEQKSYHRVVTDAIAAFNAESEAIVQAALKRKEIVLNGPLALAAVNIYDARRYRNYITSRFFLMYREETEERLLYGDFVIQMEEEKTIAAVYRWA